MFKVPLVNEGLCFCVEWLELSCRGQAEAGTRCAVTLASIRKIKGGPAVMYQKERLSFEKSNGQFVVQQCSQSQPCLYSHMDGWPPFAPSTVCLYKHYDLLTMQGRTKLCLFLFRV